MPTMAEIFQFVFRHKEWLLKQREKWEIEDFIETVGHLAWSHGMQDIPVLANISNQAEHIVSRGLKFKFYSEIDPSWLLTKDPEMRLFQIWEKPFGRAIPLTQLYDWVISCDVGVANRIAVNRSGMVITTSRRYRIEMPGCEIYLGRYQEDGHRYRTACALIKHVTGDEIDLESTELVDKVQDILVELVDGKWIVKLGADATS